MFGYINDILRYLFALIRDLLVGPILHVYSWVRRVIGEHLVPWIVDQIPPAFKEHFDAIDIAQLAALVEDVAWIFPIFTVLGIQAAALGVAATIRLLRWILAFVPTIGG